MPASSPISSSSSFDNESSKQTHDLQIPAETKSTSSRPVFELQAESIGWKNQSVLKALNLTITEGEKVAIIGKSGAGKTTLVKSLYEQAPHITAFCGQEQGLVPSLSVFHNIYMGQLNTHHFLYNFINLLRPFKKQVEAIQPLASALELGDVLFKSAEALSGGQQQRVALGRSLFQGQPIFIGDEPVSSIDEVQSERLLTLIMEQHSTVILTLHNVDLAQRFCDRIIGIRDGIIELDCASWDTTTKQLKSLYQD